MTTYAQDLNRACLAFLRAEQAEAWSANIANGARTRMGRPVRARALSPIQELAQRVLRHADPFTLPDDEPEQTDTTPTKAPMHTLTVDPTNTKIKTRKVHSHTDKERARAMHANGASTRNGHPAPYPVELAERLIRMFSFAGDVVLDPFAGSGSTSVAAMRTGRNSVSNELQPAYMRMAHARLVAESARAPHAPCTEAHVTLDAPIPPQD